MRIRSQLVVSQLMLIIFLVSLGTRGFNSQWLSHEIDHENLTNITALDEHDLIEQQHEHPSLIDSSHEVPLNDLDHRLLHAINDAPVFMVVTIAHFAQPAFHASVLLPNTNSLPTADQTPPFRPPRSTSLLA